MTVYLIVYLIGVLFGALASNIFRACKRSGTIVVQQDEEGTYLTLRIGSIEDVTSKKEVLLNVSRK